MDEYDFSAFDDSVSLEDAVSSGNWGGSADTDWYDTTGTGNYDWSNNSDWENIDWNTGTVSGDVAGSLADYTNWDNPWVYNDANIQTADPYANLPVETSYSDMSYGNPNSGSITNTLSKIFTTLGSNKNAQNLLGKGVAALLAGKQNTAAAKSYQNLANSATVDPFGAQRAQYQVQLSQGYANPNSITAVKQNMDALARAQAIKDAAAGRRSNTATSSPGLLLAQQQAQQNYLKNLASLAGANISPNTGAAANAMTQAIQSGTSGYTSPLMYLLGASNTPTTTSANNQAGGVKPQSTTGIQDLIGLFS